MQHTTRSRSHNSSGSTLAHKGPSTSLQPEGSGRGRVKGRGVSKQRTGDHGIEINSIALEAFLRNYAIELDDGLPSHGSNLSPLEGATQTAEIEPDEDDDDLEDSLYVQNGQAGLNVLQSSSRSSWILPARTSTSFDLLALIPPSAVVPYLPKLDLTIELLDKYFLELPSAKLMFNHNSVIRRYKDSTLPTEVLLAMLALASLYFQDSVSPLEIHQKPSNAKDIREQGRIWAEIASQIALARSDTNSLTTVRTCEQISLYWSAIGDRDRANHHADVSYRAYKRLVDPSSINRAGVNWNRAMLLHDFVVSYLDTYQTTKRFRVLYPKFDQWMKGEGLLPAGAALGYDTQTEWDDYVPPERYLNTKYAVASVGLWRQVNTFVQNLINGQLLNNTTLKKLENKLLDFRRALPSVLKADSLADFQLSGPCQEAMHMFAVIHCANMICLHSCRIWNLTKLTRSSQEHAAESERIVIEMAQLGGDIIHSYIMTSKQRRIPPMAGYCVFAIGAVQAHMNEFKDGAGWSDAWIRGVSCLLLLEHLGAYWPVIGQLCRNLRKRFSYSDPNMMTIPNSLLWQLIGYGKTTQLNIPNPSDSSLFDIPYSASFLHDMLGLVEEAPTTIASEEAKSDFIGTGIRKSTNRANAWIHNACSDGPMGMVGTHPPTFNFEANLLGIMPPNI